MIFYVVSLFIVFYFLIKIQDLTGQIKNLTLLLQKKGIIPDDEPVEDTTHKVDADNYTVSDSQIKSNQQIEEPKLLDKDSEAVVAPSITRSNDSWWQGVESFFIENWVGVLGAIAIVFGVGFIGVYTALQVAPYYRFLMIMATAGLLIVSNIILHKKQYWQQFSFLLGSSGCAMVLFACVGASGIQALQWVYDPMNGLMLLSFGIFVNVLFSVFSQQEWFYALHGVLSLVAISFAPANEITFLIAIITTVINLLLCFNKKWHTHQSITIIASFIFNLIWYYKIVQFGRIIDYDQQLIGVMGTLLIGFIAAAIHYQKIYAGTVFDSFLIITHLANWSFVGGGLFLFSPGFIPVSLGLAGASVLLFVSSQYAKYHGIQWLYVIDTIVAQLLAVASITSLYKFNFNYSLLFMILFVECLLFYVAMYYEQEAFLQKVARFFIYGAQVLMLVGSLVTMSRHLPEQLLVIYFSLAVTFVIGFIFYGYFADKDDFESFGTLLFSFIALLIFQWGFIDRAYSFYWEALVAGLLLIPLLYRRYISCVTTYVVYGVTVLFLHLISWFSLAQFFQNYTMLEKGVKTIPLFLLLIMSSYFSRIASLQKTVIWPFVYMFGSSLMVFSYLILHRQSTLVVGVLWLLLSIVFMEGALFFESHSSELTGNRSRHLLNMAMGFVGAFIGLHLLYHMQLEAIIGLVGVRLMMQLFAIGIFAYWLGRGWDTVKDKGYAVIVYLQPLFLELILLFMVMALALEVSRQYLTITWAVFAVLLLALTNLIPLMYNRLSMYSLFLLWNSCIYLATVTSSVCYPSEAQFWVIGCSVISIQLLYLLWVTYKNSLKNIILPPALDCFESFMQFLGCKKSSWIFYPFFIAVAMFLYWKFGKSVLTLCWMMEVFMVFILGILLQEDRFRTLSLGVLVICAGRLVFYDLVQTETLTRGIVFLSFGGILLLMHAIHNYFKSKISE